MKHLFLTNDFPPNYPGGMANYYWGLTTHFLKDSVAVATFKGDLDCTEVDKKAQFPVYRIAFRLKTFSSILPWIRLTLRIVKQEKISLIHCGNSLTYGFIALFINLFHKIPYTLYFHGFDFFRFLSCMEKSWFHSFAYKLMVARARVVVCNSQYTANLAGTHLNIGRERTIIAYPCVDDVFLSQGVLENTPSKSMTTPLKLISVGRLVERKGFDRVIEAIALLKQQSCKVNYRFAGYGDPTWLCDLADRNGVADAVSIAGTINTASALIEEYLQADVFIMPSRTTNNGRDVEGFGIVFLEAAALKLPCIGSRSGGVPEAIEHKKTGLLVDDPDSARQIADAILFFIANPAMRKTFGEAGYERVLSRFSWDATATHLFNSLGSLCKSDNK